MSDKITNAELLRSIDKLDNKLENKLEKLEGKIENFKYWALGIVASIFVAATFLKLPIF